MCQEICPQGGMHGKGKHAWQGGHARWGEGTCVAGGVHGGGHAWQGVCMAVGACVAGGTATAADSMHPTGMHSCYFYSCMGRKVLLAPEKHWYQILAVNNVRYCNDF